MDIKYFFEDKLNSDIINIMKEYLTLDDIISCKLHSTLNKSRSIDNLKYHKISTSGNREIFRDDIKININNTNKTMIFSYISFNEYSLFYPKSYLQYTCTTPNEIITDLIFSFSEKN